MKTYTPEELAEFRRVPGFEKYLVSRSGDVLGPTLRKLSPSKRSDGYLQVVLFDQNGRRKSAKVHRLVAMAFLSAGAGQPMVNHLDGNKANNSVENLEWCSASRNARHAYSAGLIVPACGERHGASRLKAEDVARIRASSLSSRKLALKYQVSPATIQKVLNGKTWKLPSATPEAGQTVATAAA